MKHALLVQDAKVFGLFEKFVQLCNKRATCATWHIKILQPSDSPSVEEGPSGGGANTGGGGLLTGFITLAVPVKPFMKTINRG